MKAKEMVATLRELVEVYGNLTVRFTNAYTMCGYAVGKVKFVKNGTFYSDKEQKYKSCSHIVLKPFGKVEMTANDLIRFLQKVNTKIWRSVCCMKTLGLL